MTNFDEYAKTSAVYCIFEVLCCHAIKTHDERLYCIISVSDIAEYSGFCPVTVRRSVKRLCEMGYVRRVPCYSETQAQLCNRYEILMNCKSSI